MVYSHAHLDHIGASKRVLNYAKKHFPLARIVVWGTQETKDMIKVHTTNRAVKVDMVVNESGRTLALGPGLKVKLMIVGGHTQQDIAALIPRSKGWKGIVFYVDVVYPEWSPSFNLAITQDVRQMIIAQNEILKLEFDILVPGHLRIGTKEDIRRNIAYTEDLLKETKNGLNLVTPEQLVKAGIGKVGDVNAREYGNQLYGVKLTMELGIDACYRSMIGKWGCRLAGLDIFLRSHGFTAIAFAVLEL